MRRIAEGSWREDWRNRHTSGSRRRSRWLTGGPMSTAPASSTKWPMFSPPARSSVTTWAPMEWPTRTG